MHNKRDYEDIGGADLKKIIKSFILIIIILSYSILLPILMDSFHLFNSTIEAADEAEWSETVIDSPGGGSGSSDGIFTVLEIVPYKGMGEIGYLVGGQEPIDKELIPWDMIGKVTGIVGNEISIYPSYVDEFMKPEEEGFNKTGATTVTQNGYFKDTKEGGAGKYSKSNTPSYVRVAANAGNYKAVLVEESQDYYNVTTGQIRTNLLNVKAYFVKGKTSGDSLYSTTIPYNVSCVTENTDGTGDYIYDCDTSTFILNKGNGTYDVRFTKSGSTTNAYYMLANYEIVDDNSGTNSWSVTYQSAGENNGNYIQIPYSFQYEQYWGGTYQWIQSETSPNSQYDTKKYYLDGDNLWIHGQKISKNYKFKYTVELVNNEWLKRYTLGIDGLDAKDYSVKVITATPEEVNEHPEYIEHADMIYINQSKHNEYVQLYELYNQVGLNLPSDQKYYNTGKPLSFVYHDLSWPSVVAIFERVAGINCNRAAIVIDSVYYQYAMDPPKDGSADYFIDYRKPVTVTDVWISEKTNNASVNNLAKLYIMLYQRDTQDFYNTFMDPDSTNPYKIIEKDCDFNLTGTTGSYVRNDHPAQPKNADGTENEAYLQAYAENKALYWNKFTFIPFGLNESETLIRYATDADVKKYIPNFNMTSPTGLNDNVYVLGGQEIFSGNVFLVKEPYSRADIIKIITNSGNGYGNTGGEGGDSEGEDGNLGSNLRTYISVLNIQPTADFITSEANIRTILDGYKFQIVNMTSVQFNSSLEDINTHYDMIYMGSGSGRFNFNTATPPTTIFNDNKTTKTSTSMNNTIYFSIGDLINTSKTERYTGNDLTSLKKSELKSFLDAGYPIVLQESIYNLTNVGKNNTNLYTFISENKSKYKNLIKDLPKNKTFDEALIQTMLFYSLLGDGLNVIQPKIRLEKPLISEDADTNYVYVDPVTKSLVIEFELLPRGILPSSKTYNASLYLDTNGDGLFTSLEKLPLILSGTGSSWENIKESKYIKYIYKYNMKNLNGAYQWKVEVVRNDNLNIRSEVTGYTAFTKKQDINVLQIIKDASSYNLENKVSDSASRIYEYTMGNILKDYNLHFDTITVSEFENLFITQPFSNQLSNYHVLILDNQDTPISDAKGAVTNIKSEIEKHLGVIFTKGTINFDRSSNFFRDTINYSFKANDTYNRLNQSASGGQLYIYNNLLSNGGLNLPNTYLSTYVTKTNEGIITQYPYKIGNAIKTADNSYSEDTTIDFNRTQSQPLIGWYCLSDSKSPVVRGAGLVSGTVTSDTLYQGMYSSSPNDVTNNYYLFSKGWVYYSGIHLGNANARANDNDDYDDEMKLFVNTIIATHQAAKRPILNISIVSPEPDIAPNFSQSITVDMEGKTEFILTFKVSESSTNMDLSITWDGLISNDWNKKVFKVNESNEVSATPILIDNVEKKIAIGTYAIKIPISDLSASNKLIITAENVTKNIDSTEVTLIGDIQKPVITVIDPKPIGTEKYIYADIDYLKLDTDDDNLSTEEALRLEFDVTMASTNVLIDVKTKDSLGILNSIVNGSFGNVLLYSISIVDGKETEIAAPLTGRVANGKYVLYLPMALMKEINSREITITAADTNHNVGESTITLLRRNLFPLD